MDLISIVIPVYNVEKYIEKCAKSLMAQTYDHLELIFINDGSTDSSGELCHKVAEQNNNENIKIIVIDKENGGVSSARNRGLEVVSGKYVMYVDPDDYCELTYVEKLYRAIVDSDADMAECSFFIDYTADSIVAKELPFSENVTEDVFGALFYDGYTMNKLPAYLWLGIFKADVIRDNNIRFDENVKYGEDFLFFVEYSRYCARIAIVNEPLYHSVHRDGSSASRLKFSIDHSMRTLYLTDEFLRIMKDVEWDLKGEYIAKRYLNFMPQAAILITRTKGYKHRRRALAELMVKSEISEKLGEYLSYKKTSLEKIYSLLTRRKSALLLLLYGRVYNCLRSIKRFVTKKQK